MPPVRWLVLIVAALALLAGCGGDDEAAALPADQQTSIDLLVEASADELARPGSWSETDLAPLVERGIAVLEVAPDAPAGQLGTVRETLDLVDDRISVAHLDLASRIGQALGQ